MAGAFLTLLCIELYRGFSGNKFNYAGIIANALLFIAMLLSLRDLKRSEADKL